MKNLAKSYLCMVVPFSVQIQAFYRQNPNHKDPGEIGGANAPPNSLTLPRKRGLGRGQGVARWPHPVGGSPRFLPLTLSGVGFALWLRDFEEMVVDLCFNWSILRGFFSTSFQPLDFVLIQWVRINSDLIQNWWALGSFLFISLKIGPANKSNN